MFGLNLGDVLGLHGVPGLINTNQNLFNGLIGGTLGGALGGLGGTQVNNYTGGAGNLSELFSMTRPQNTSSNFGSGAYLGGGGFI
jgi:hypothetical protein